MFFFLASSLTMGYRAAGRENLWPKYAAAFSSSTVCSLFNRIHKKKYKKNKKCYNHDCLASPFLPHLILSVKCGTMKIVAIQGALYDLEEEEKENLKKLINHFMKLW